MDFTKKIRESDFDYHSHYFTRNCPCLGTQPFKGTRKRSRMEHPRTPGRKGSTRKRVFREVTGGLRKGFPEDSIFRL